MDEEKKSPGLRFKKLCTYMVVMCRDVVRDVSFRLELRPFDVGQTFYVFFA